MNTKQVFDRHNKFLLQQLIPKPGEPIEGNSITDPEDKNFHQPIKAKP